MIYGITKRGGGGISKSKTEIFMILDRQKKNIEIFYNSPSDY